MKGRMGNLHGISASWPQLLDVGHEGTVDDGDEERRMCDR